MNTGLTSKLYAWPGLVVSGWCFSPALAGLPFQLAVLSKTFTETWDSKFCWNSFGLFRDCGLNLIFYRNKTFLFFKIESWNFQHLFEKKIREALKNFNSFRQFLFFNVWLSWNFVRIRNFFFKGKRSILNNKNKYDSGRREPREFQQMPLCCPNFQ